MHMPLGRYERQVIIQVWAYRRHEVVALQMGHPSLPAYHYPESLFWMRRVGEGDGGRII